MPEGKKESERESMREREGESEKENSPGGALGLLESSKYRKMRIVYN